MFRNRLPFFDARLLCIPRRQQARLDRFELAIVDNLIYAFERSVQLRVELVVIKLGICPEFQVADICLDGSYGRLSKTIQMVAQRVTQLTRYVRRPRLTSPIVLRR